MLQALGRVSRGTSGYIEAKENDLDILLARLCGLLYVRYRGDVEVENGRCVDCSLRGFREVRSVEGQGTRSSSVFAARVKWFPPRQPP